MERRSVVSFEVWAEGPKGEGRGGKSTPACVFAGACLFIAAVSLGLRSTMRQTTPAHHTLLACPSDIDHWLIAGRAGLCRPHDAQWPGYNCAAFQMAAELSLSLKTESGKVFILWQGCNARVYQLDDGKVLNVALHKMSREREIVIAMNMPHTDTIARPEKKVALSNSESSWVGQVEPMLLGKSGISYYRTAPTQTPTPRQVLEVASDIVLALHALHTKIKGYVVVHCDMTELRNVVISEGDPWRATLVDFKMARVHKLQEHERTGGLFFTGEAAGCSPTNWGVKKSGNPKDKFGAYSDWREAGISLFGMATPDDLFGDANGECDGDERCAAALNIDKSILDPDLKELLHFLVVQHEAITDDERDLLTHRAFKEFRPTLAERAARIEAVEPSRQFEGWFSPRIVQAIEI